MTEKNSRKVYIWIATLLILTATVFGILYTQNENLSPEMPQGEWSVYIAPTLGTIQYPSNFLVKENYTYSVSPTEELRGVAFRIPIEETQGTNLAEDSYLSIEHAATSDCEMSDFLDHIISEERIVDQGMSYTVLRGGGAAAGNLYEEIVYVMRDCLAVRYFIHTTRVENYEPGTVREYDRAALLSIFDAMRRSYRLPQ